MRWAVVLLVAFLVSGCASNGGSDGGADPGESPDTQRPVQADLARTGRWLPPFEGEVPAINMVLLHDGRVLYWSGVEADESDGSTDIVFFNAAPRNASSRVLDLSGEVPAVLEPINPDGAGSDLFCAGQTVLPDGRVLAIGASDWSFFPTTTPFLSGGTDARIFDPATDTWERKSDMLFGRWYPSLITLPDGKALAVSGIGSLTNPTEQWPQMEVYDPADDTWTYVAGGDRLLPLYPRVTVVPGSDGPQIDEGVFYNTLGTLWGPFGEHPRQAEWSTQAALGLQPASWSDQERSILGARQHGASVMQMLEPDAAPQFVNFGGTLYQSVVATPLVETVDLATTPPTNALADPMAFPRWHLNGLLLPTGEMLAVGGGLYDNVIVHGQQNVPVLEAESFDPATGQWTTLAPMTVPRMYHSTALLLPDGRVLAGGHVPLPNPSKDLRDTVNPQTVETRFEVFEPPYLFRGDRPVILDAPAEVHYWDSMTVEVDRPADIVDVVLMRPGATTHAFDSDARGLRLPFNVTADGLGVQLPATPYAAPPGHYMLFVLADGEGGPVPSVARWIHVGPASSGDAATAPT